MEPVDHSTVEARYSNTFRVGYNAFEFAIELGQFYEDQEGPRIHTRIITSPVYTKVLSRLLCDTIRDYEREHGAIPGESA